MDQLRQEIDELRQVIDALVQFNTAILSTDGAPKELISMIKSRTQLVSSDGSTQTAVVDISTAKTISINVNGVIYQVLYR